IEAVSGGVAESSARPEALDHVRRRDNAETLATIGFRPLECPNCGWDLPAEPADVVFEWPGCDRAWLIEGERLLAQEVAIASLPARAPLGVDYRPFGEIRREVADRDAPGPAAAVRRCLVPAFRHPNFKRLNDLAVRLSRRAPALTTRDGTKFDL